MGYVYFKHVDLFQNCRSVSEVGLNDTSRLTD